MTDSTSRNETTVPQAQKKKWRWWHFALASVGLIVVLSATSGGSSPGSLCKNAATKTALQDAFINKLSKLGATLMDDYAALGQQGEAIVCSVSFSIPALTKESMAAIDRAPTVASEVEGHAMTFAMLPNLMMQAATNPGQPLVQRLTYRVNKTLNDKVLVTVTDYPGARNLR